MDLKAHLKTLSEHHAPSGYEGPIREYLQGYWAGWADELDVHPLGNLTGIKYGRGPEPRKRIMLCAHMDEIAMMVTEIREGYLRVDSIAGIDGRTLQAKSVIVQGKRQLIGTVAAVPPHISKSTGAGRSTYPTIKEQWIDLGLPADEVNALVSIGDIVTMDAPLLELKGGLVAGKALDDRASVATVSFCLELLHKRLHEWDVYAVASVQEEKTGGYAGATTAAYTIQPHLAIAIDVGFAKQPGLNDNGAVEAGKGPVISRGPNFHPALFKRLKHTAKEYEIPLNEEVLTSESGTDAWPIQVSRQGVPTALLNIPIRNMHSTVETASLKDIKRVGRLMAEFITELDEETLESLAWSHTEEEDNEDED